MNYRSISFRLSAWYSGIVAITLGGLCLFAYLGLYKYMKADLSSQLSDQANQIATTWLREISASGSDYVVSEIDEHVSPQITNHFVRITKGDGSMLYQPKPPYDGSFDPALVAASPPSAGFREEYPGGKELLIYALRVDADGGGSYTLEVGKAFEHIR
ncbi:MAG: hypothetical protein ACREAC_17100, partial [Blastocatellia bacterium]